MPPGLEQEASDSDEQTWTLHYNLPLCFDSNYKLIQLQIFGTTLFPISIERVSCVFIVISLLWKRTVHKLLLKEYRNIIHLSTLFFYE
jgi:hypothetical protein